MAGEMSQKLKAAHNAVGQSAAEAYTSQQPCPDPAPRTQSRSGMGAASSKEETEMRRMPVAKPQDEAQGGEPSLMSRSSFHTRNSILVSLILQDPPTASYRVVLKYSNAQ